VTSRGIKLVLGFVALALALFNPLYGDLRFSAGNWTVRHWSLVPAVERACAGEALAFPLVTGGAYPCAAAMATTYTLTGPSSGKVGIASSNYTVTPTGGTATAVVTPADTTNECIFSPTTVTFAGTGALTFTCVPLVAASGTVATTNNGGLTDPSGLALAVPNLATTWGYPGFTSTLSTNGATLVTSVSGDPFSGTNAATLTEDTSTGVHFIDNSPAPDTQTANTSYTYSTMVKQGSGTRNASVGVCDSTFAACLVGIFNPSTCAFVSDGSTGGDALTSHLSISLSNGWCLIEVVGTLGNFTSVFENTIMYSGTTESYTGNGTSFILMSYGIVRE
jgi:hypothetical protein